MKNGPIDKLNSFFNKLAFKKSWGKYRKAFGEELDEIFGDNYDVKLRLSEGLEDLLNRRFNDAYHKIRHFEINCVTEVDKRIFNKLLTLCFNEEEMAKVKVGDWVKKSSGGYCQVLKKNNDYAVVKQAFDFEQIYVKESRRVDCFKITITDLKTYQFLEHSELSCIKAFFSKNPQEEKHFVKQTEKMLSFREAILKAGFKEAAYDFQQFHFYRYTTEKIAFILNLKDLGDCIQVTYGFTSIADEEFLKNHGEDDCQIKLRFASIITSEEDEKAAANAIKNVFDTYMGTSKDEILALKKERQKEFLQKINDRLKPLEFKKKNTKWIKALNEEYCLQFDAQKSQWSDEYYFNISVYNKEMYFPYCYTTRLNTNGKGIYNWQFMTDEELSELINGAIENVIMPIIKTPFAELGKKVEIWQGCMCPRNKCNPCWVHKNLWEANGLK